MCTLSVITSNDGYLLAMNRDERIARGAGTLPEIYQVNGTTAIYPSDGAGGAWIAANQYGITLALLNWNDLAPNGTAAARTRSRGRVIPALISSRSLLDLHEVLGVSNFKGMPPFRLVGALPSEQEIWEWRWDSRQLESRAYEWKPQHWFSSSLSDEWATSLRGAVCRNAQLELDAGSAAWLHRLHASHAGGPGAFSLCVHRDDVKTLSYSEVMVTGGHVQMGHSLGSPCSTAQIHSTEIERAACLVRAATDASSSGI
jgi:Transport and Golgi organisation 2